MTCANYHEPEPHYDPITLRPKRGIKPSVRNDRERNALVARAAKIVRSQARTWAGRLPTLDLADAESAGWEGALRAAELWTEEGGASYETYARLWIRKKIAQAADKSRAVTLPERARLLGGECAIASVGDGDGCMTIADGPGLYSREADEREDYENDMDDLEDAIRSLPAVEREAVMTCFIAEENASDTADDLGLKSADVDSALTRGIARLRHILSGGVEPEPPVGVVGVQARLVDAEVVKVERAKVKRSVNNVKSEQRGLFG